MRAVNLIPHDQRRGAGGVAGRSGGIVYVVAGGLLVVVALGVVYAFAVHSVASRKGELAQVTQQVGSVQLQTAALQPYVQVSNLRKAKVAAVVALAESRFDWPDAMRQLALALPSDVSLTQFSATVGSGTSSATTAAPSTRTTTGGPQFVLQGCASSQSETALVLTRLEQTPGITDVQLQTTAKSVDTAPNSAGPGPRSTNLASSGKCPRVAFILTATYSPTYTLPNQKLPNSATTGGQTVSSGSASTTTIARSASSQAATVNR